MIWVAIVFFVGALLIFGISFRLPKTGENTSYDGPSRGLVGVFSYVLAGISLVMAFFSCIAIVPAGHVGIPVLFGQVQGNYLPEGLHFVNPFLSVPEMNVRTQSYVMVAAPDEGQVQGDDSIKALSADGLEMPLEVSVPYRIVPQAAPWVYQNFGENYLDTMLRNPSRSAVREATASFNADEAYSKARTEMTDEMHKCLVSQVNHLIHSYDKQSNSLPLPADVVVFPTVMLRRVGLPEKVKAAIERKLEADQQAQEMDFKITKEEKEAKRKEVEASGIKKFQDIVSEGINENLLRWKAIDATQQLSESSNAKVVIIGSGKDGLPVILGGAASKD